jgi:adenylylsulfate kinase
MPQRATHVTWHHGLVSREERERRMGQSGAVLWFTGLSGSGKSTIARALEQQLLDAGRVAYVLDGDNLRHGLNADLGFSAEDRTENIRRVGAVAQLFADAGVLCITAFISPFQQDRDRVRALLPEGRFIEVFIDTPLDICEQRDPKGLYQKARSGEIKDFTGISSPYEPPAHPEVHVRTAARTVEACATDVHTHLERTGLVSPRSGSPT